MQEIICQRTEIPEAFLRFVVNFSAGAGSKKNSKTPSLHRVSVLGLVLVW